jgi:hypothetical protein
MLLLPPPLPPLFAMSVVAWLQKNAALMSSSDYKSPAASTVAILPDQ